jgi:hypothetical protein
MRYENYNPSNHMLTLLGMETCVRLVKQAYEDAKDPVLMDRSRELSKAIKKALKEKKQCELLPLMTDK